MSGRWAGRVSSIKVGKNARKKTPITKRNLLKWQWNEVFFVLTMNYFLEWEFLGRFFPVILLSVRASKHDFVGRKFMSDTTWCNRYKKTLNFKPLSLIIIEPFHKLTLKFPTQQSGTMTKIVEVCTKWLQNKCHQKLKAPRDASDMGQCLLLR